MSQAKNLQRVDARIAHAVVAFWQQRVASTQQEFHMDDVTEYVRLQHQIAPDSAGRVMRDLRQRGKINYEVVSRRDSRYRALPTMEMLCGKQ